MKTRYQPVFIYILLFFTLMLMTLPLVMGLNQSLTQIVENNAWYGFLRRYIIPIEAKMIGALLLPAGYRIAFSPANSTLVVNNLPLGITWNCLGWQSFLLFFLTLVFGLEAKYTRSSLIQALLIGILGTFWLNILRMSLTILLAVHLPPLFRIVYHDYLAAITTIIWLFIFWWFAYTFVLETKNSLIEQN